jgi:hypothetical protein
VNAYYRSKQHFDNPERNKLKEIHILTDEEFNVSATLDIESWLIQYISADGQYIIQGLVPIDERIAAASGTPTDTTTETQTPQEVPKSTKPVGIEVMYSSKTLS